MRKIFTILTVLVFIGAAMFFYRDEDSSIFEGVEIIKEEYYSCDNGISISLKPKLDFSEINLKYNDSISVLFIKDGQGVYRNENMIIYTQGESIKIQDLSSAEIISCTPLLDHENSPINFGD